MVKIVIAGSRSIKNFDKIEKILNSLDFLKNIDDIEIVHGGAVGVDTCGKMYAEKYNIRHKIFYPNYNVYGKRAPLVRNEEMADYGDILVVFHDGISTGTKNMMSHMEKRNKEIHYYKI